MSLPVLHLKPGRQRRSRRGHLWIYSNEVADDLGAFEGGQSVTVLDERGKPIGSGTVNPHTLIAVRLHSKRADQELDKPFLTRRIGTALRLREQLSLGQVARLVHAEGDGLPGLIVDRYGDVLAVQHGSVGMDRRKEVILEVLDELLAPRSVLLMDDAPSRELEGLPLGRAYAGEEPDEVIWYTQQELEWPLDWLHGQKTGDYLDQSHNRIRLARFAPGLEVLDAFSYTGGFGMIAAAHGAKRVALADRSERALALAKEAFARNDLPPPELVHRDLLRQAVPFADLAGVFDLVLLDPPPLIKNKGKKKEGLRRFQQLVEDAMTGVRPEGLLALFSCSHHMGREDLLEQIRRAERRVRRPLRLLEEYSAGPDHPIALSHSETEYLHGTLHAVG